ncbi:MAG: hypothetical protein LBJ43_06100 [Propionibacteriaceae bacterium]|jgi:transposase-like protein|nr:hypothetical protein [Propionibacteriaceae bacterium]
MARRYDPQVRDRAVKMVLAHLGEYSSVYQAARVIGPRVGVGAESLRQWVVLERSRDMDVGGGEQRVETKRIKELERQVRDLSEANEILKAASIFFAGELDPRRPRR